MCLGSGPRAPTPPPAAPEAPQLPAPATRANASNDERRRASGAMSNVLTSMRGVTAGGTTATKTLLGQ